MIHPQFDPVALSLGSIQVHWYGISYMMAFLLAYGLAWYRSQRREGWSPDMVTDLVFYGMLGVILGGRIGYTLLYSMDKLLENPLYLFKVWEGGMSFHGGFIGVGLAMWYFARKYKKNLFSVLDFIIPCVPTGLLSGRLANYVNVELWGRIPEGGYNWLTYFPHAVTTDANAIHANPELKNLAYAMPQSELSPDLFARLPASTQAFIQQSFESSGAIYLLPRHPSQLYQAMTEGLLMFLLIWWFSSKPRPRMAVTGLFTAGYGISRFFIEFFRQPDAGYELIFGWMSKGQLYCIPMIVIGLGLLMMAYRQQVYDWGRV